MAQLAVCIKAHEDKWNEVYSPEIPEDVILLRCAGISAHPAAIPNTIGVAHRQ